MKVYLIKQNNDSYKSFYFLMTNIIVGILVIFSLLSFYFNDETVLRVISIITFFWGILFVTSYIPGFFKYRKEIVTRVEVESNFIFLEVNGNMIKISSSEIDLIKYSISYPYPFIGFRIVVGEKVYRFPIGKGYFDEFGKIILAFCRQHSITFKKLTFEFII